MKSSKRDHDCTSSSEEDVTYKRLKTFHKKHSKRRHSTSSSDSISSSSTSSSDSRCTEDHKSRKHKVSKESKLRYKTKSKMSKKSKKSLKQKSSKSKKASKRNKLKDKSGKLLEKVSMEKDANYRYEASNDIPLHLMDKSMAPMTKEQWEKQQSIVQKVYDDTTGRYRLIKGDGEVIEEIVSRERHKQINQQATRGDGEYFQSNLKQLNIRK